MAPIRVLIVDDSALVRSLLKELLSSDPALEVIGTAGDAYVARRKIKELSPDVLTLDVEMPKMDGLTFLRNLMRLHPMPVVMVSSLTERGADVTLEALALGAVDYLPKPRFDIAAQLREYREELLLKVKGAAAARVRPIAEHAARPGTVPVTARRPPMHSTERIIGIGASTGGTEAIREVLSQLPEECPAVLIVQHIPKAFSAPFARRLNACCPLIVHEAQDDEPVLPGHAYIAPGDRHLLLVRDGSTFMCRLDDGPPVNRHKPSVDVLFRSVAQQAGENALGVILTGMGKDGAVGLKEMREAGCQTIAQDEATSVVWGMPREAVALQAAGHLVPLGAISARIMRLIEAAR